MSLPAELPSAYPISDLRTRLNDIETQARETRQPIILTRNGASSLVVMDHEAYNEQIRHERAVRKLREAEIEAHYRSESFAHDDVKERMRKIIETAQMLYA